MFWQYCFLTYNHYRRLWAMVMLPTWSWILNHQGSSSITIILTSFTSTSFISCWPSSMSDKSFNNFQYCINDVKEIIQLSSLLHWKLSYGPKYTFTINITVRIDCKIDFDWIDLHTHFFKLDFRRPKIISTKWFSILGDMWKFFIDQTSEYCFLYPKFLSAFQIQNQNVISIASIEKEKVSSKKYRFYRPDIYR